MPFTKSLRAKVLVSALIPITLALVVVAIIALFAYERAARDVVLQRDAELANVSAARLAEGLSQLNLLLQSIAEDDDVRSLEAARMKGALERELDQLLVFNAGVVIYNDQGMAVWSDPFAFRRRGASFPVPSEFDKVLTTLMPSFSNVFTDEISGEDVVLLTAPIVARGPEFKGVAAGMSTLNSLLLNATYSEVLEITEDSERFAYLVDGNGRVIFHSDRSRLGTDLSAIVPVKRVTEGNTSAVIAEGPEGKTVISGFAPVPDTDWAVITQERWQSVVGPIRGFSRLLLCLLVVGGVLSAVLVFFAIGRVLKPVKDLTEGAKRIAGGDFVYSIATNSGDEIEELATEFNLMAEQVKGSYEELEQRVAERTEELGESEERYRTLFEESGEAIFISDDSKIVAVNQAALDMFEFTRADAIGSYTADRYADPADQLRFREEVTHAGAVRDFEVKLLKKDGTPMDCLLTASLRPSPDGTASGEIQGIVRDVTQSKLAEEAELQQTREVAVLEERNRMAREIHDTMAQGFTGIVLQLEAAEQAMEDDAGGAIDHLGRARNLAREGLQEARRSVWGLLPHALEQASLDSALQEEVRRFDSAGSEKTEISISGKTRELPDDVQTVLLRICQESLTNIRRHAGATEVSVSLNYNPREVRLGVKDNDVGFDPANFNNENGGRTFGLIGMEQRAQQLEGSLAIKSGKGKGTLVEITIPTP